MTVAPKESVLLMDFVGVNKKDCSIRLCADYRVTISDNFRIQEAVDLILSIGKAKVISKLGLLNAIELRANYTIKELLYKEYRFENYKLSMFCI